MLKLFKCYVKFERDIFTKWLTAYITVCANICRVKAMLFEVQRETENGEVENQKLAGLFWAPTVLTPLFAATLGR